MIAALASLALVPTAVTAVTTDPPTGVTLRPVDGGPGYFGRWTNSLPSDPSFFPIGVWGETLPDSTDARNVVDRYDTMGINFYSGDWGIAPAIKTKMAGLGMYVLSDEAHTTFDEPDWRGCADGSGGIQNEATSWFPWFSTRRRTMNSTTGAPNSGPAHPAWLQQLADGLRARDASRPVFGQFTKIARAGTSAQDSWVDDADARAYIAANDIISYDWFVLTDACHYTPCSYGNVWNQGDAVRNVRRLANYTKPVWPAIETSYVTDYATYRPSAADVNAEVWHSIIAGARGIHYFNHDFKAGTARVLQDPRYTDITTQVTKTNTLITQLAPVLNAPYADGYLTSHTGNIDTMVKYDARDGSFYLFTASRQNTPQDVTFNLATGTTIEAIGENRTLTTTNGRFTDRFTNNTTIHIYKIRPA
jgi:hypothetical protein